MNSLLTIITSSVVLLAIDVSYLSTFGKPFIDQTVKIQNAPFQLNMMGAFFSYLCIIILLNYFVLLRSGTLFDAFLLGTLSYGVYDMTNMALFKDWDMTLAVIDSIWGGTLFTFTTFITNWILSTLYK
uniref:DUF2177 family protein n=1 Tax=viral metagenome TaxID=1070528 RepID=A0A6C0AVC8_9ZZZZ|tara:strand:- start:19644 stop:20027 length:384 start_codon:yes stop_codon:yes gene_type:complete